VGCPSRKYIESAILMSEPIQVSQSVTFTVMELLIVGGSCFILFIALIGFLIYLSYRDRQQMFSVAEDFERNLLSEVGNPKASTDAAPAESPSGGMAAPIPLSPPPSASDSPLDGVVQKLRTMGLIGDFQQAVPLGFGPDGQVYALKAGGTVLVLPRMESEAFLAHAMKSHVMVVALTSDGRALVITPLGQQMSVTVQRTETRL